MADSADNKFRSNTRAQQSNIRERLQSDVDFVSRLHEISRGQANARLTESND